MSKTILENLMACSDQELISQMPYIRIDGEPVVSLVQLKHVLREEYKQLKELESNEMHRLQSTRQRTAGDLPSV